MKANYITVLSIGIALSMASCGDNTNNDNAAEHTADSIATGKPLPPVSINTVSPSPDFPGATLTMGAVKTEKAGTDSVKVSFNFKVDNYELKLQTADNGAKMCNNSDKGQHIHFILDNSPYKALYEPMNEVTVANNSEHYLVAFLSRSYHESIKSKGAAIMYHFKIDEKGNLKKSEMPQKPMLTYSRPKGDYAGNDTANVLLDFYIWNCTLSAEGYKVKAHISNLDRPTQTLDTIFVNWAPYFIQNLGTGKCKTELSLIDKDGNIIEGSSINREFNLKAQ